MVRYNKKFFFLDKPKDTKSKKGKSVKEPKVKEPKPKKVKEKKTNNKTFSFYMDRIKFYFKKYMFIIIGIAVLVFIILFIKACSSNKSTKTDKPKKSNNTNTKIVKPVVVDSISINLNQEVPTIYEFVKNYDKFKKDDDSITYDQNNFVNNKYNVVGDYPVTIIIDGTEYTSRIVVIDKEPPILSLKEVIITEGTVYNITDFVSSCSDNSGKACTITYEKTEDGKYTSVGTYDINIIAEDLSGNKTEAQTAKLTINAKPVNPTPRTNPSKKVTCQFGSTSYTSDHVLTYSVVKNKCPIDIKYQNSETYYSTPQQLAVNDLAKLKQQIKDKGIDMEIQFDIYVVAVKNNEGTGLVGYSAYITGKNTYNNKQVINYDLNSNGTRKYNLNLLGI